MMELIKSKNLEKFINVNCFMVTTFAFSKKSKWRDKDKVFTDIGLFFGLCFFGLEQNNYKDYRNKQI